MNPKQLVDDQQQQQQQQQGIPSLAAINDMDWIIKPTNHNNARVGGLAISGLEFCEDKEKMEREQFKAVVSVCGDKLMLPVQVQHLWIVVEDHPREDISMFFNSAYDFIDRHIREGNVLVHCRAGISRSSSIVIAYLIKKNKLDFQQALSLVRMERPIVHPNKGFTKQLRRLANQVQQNSNQAKGQAITKNKANGCLMPTKKQECTIF